MFSLSSVPGMGTLRQRGNNALRITNDDLNHMNGFPAVRKLALIETIMSCAPAASVAFTGNNHYERAILRLRRDEFRLIDLQPQELLFTSVWYRKCRSAMKMSRIELAMLLWVSKEELTNLTMWRI